MEQTLSSGDVGKQAEEDGCFNVTSSSSVSSSKTEGGDVKKSSSTSSTSSNKPSKIVLQQGHVLLDPFYGGFPTTNIDEGGNNSSSSSPLRGGDRSRSSSSSSSSGSSTSGSEFDEINYPSSPTTPTTTTAAVCSGSRVGSGEAGAISSLLTVTKLKKGSRVGGNSSCSLKRLKGTTVGIFEGGGGGGGYGSKRTAGGGERQRPRSDSSAAVTVTAKMLLPTVILTTGEDDDDIEVDEDDNDYDDAEDSLEVGNRECNEKRQDTCAASEETDNEEDDDIIDDGSSVGSSNGGGFVAKRKNQISPCWTGHGGDGGGRSNVSQLVSLSASQEGEQVERDPSSADHPVTSTIRHQRRQSLKHLSVSAPAMRTASTKSGSGGDGSDSGLPPMTTSKSRQKKFHRHFKNVPQDEKVLDYYSCALVGDILLQGFLYITENYFAFYSNVFGYVTKVLIPVCTVVRITKERTAKIFPNAVGVCTRTEKHVFASLISRDTTFKLMCKVWNYSIEQEAEEIRQLQRRVAAEVEAEDGFSADVPVPDESSGDSGSGNDSAIEPSSHSPSPQNTPGIEKLVHAKTAVPSHMSAAATTLAAAAGAQGGVVVGEDKSVTLIGGAKITAEQDSSSVPNILNYRGTNYRTSISNAANASATTNAHLLHGTAQRQSQQQQDSSQFRRIVRSLGLNTGGRGPSLLLVATALLVILFISAALLLSRISSLQQRILERPVIHDSEQFYQELLSWQTKLHSTTGEEIHQYINSNLQQIVKVRESLEALSMLFVNRPHQGAPSLGEAHSNSLMGGGGDHHHHHKDS